MMLTPVTGCHHCEVSLLLAWVNNINIDANTHVHTHMFFVDILARIPDKMVVVIWLRFGDVASQLSGYISTETNNGPSSIHQLNILIGTRVIYPDQMSGQVMQLSVFRQRIHRHFNQC
jgi:hypothetical protein